MCTETYIKPLPKPARTPDIRLKSVHAWIQDLRMNTTRVEMGLTARVQIRRQRITRPRSRRVEYRSNCLFFSPDAELILQLRNRKLIAEPGTIIWIPPGIPYSLYLTEEPDGQTVYRTRFSIYEDGILTTPWEGAELFPDCTWYPEFISNVLKEKVVADDFTLHQHRMLLQELSIRLFRSRHQPKEKTSVLSHAQQRAIHDYLVTNIASRPAPSDLARAAGLSASYFPRVFYKAYGMSPRRWIMDQRIRYSTHLLSESRMKVREVAHALGYDEPRLYTRQFGEVMGKSPREFRKRR